MKEEVVSSHEDLKDKYIFLEVYSAWETVVLRATEDVLLSSVVEER